MDARVKTVIERYESCFGRDPAPAGAVAAIESALGVILPADFKAIAAAASGDLLPLSGLLRLAGPEVPEGIAGRTLALRRELGLPSRYVALVENLPQVVLLETRHDQREAAPVLMLNREALPALAKDGFVYGRHTTFGTYTAWFEMNVELLVSGRELRKARGLQPDTEEAAVRIFDEVRGVYTYMVLPSEWAPPASPRPGGPAHYLITPEGRQWIGGAPEGTEE